MFTKAGRTPDRIINVLETDEAELVSRDTYHAFKDAADAYKLNKEEDTATRNMRTFIEEEKKTQKDEDEDKDKKDVEDHGRNIADILPFDAKTLAQINLENVYTSAEDGPERAALMRIIQDVAHPLTQQQLEGLALFFARHKKNISKVEKDDIRKVIQYITANGGIRETQKMLKQQATSWGDLLQQNLLAGMGELGTFFKNKMPAPLNELFESFGDWWRTTHLMRGMDKMVGLIVFVLRKGLFFARNLAFLMHGLSEIYKNGFDKKYLCIDYETFAENLKKEPISNSLFFSTLYISMRFIDKIVNNMRTTLLISTIAIIVIACCLYMQTGYTGGVLTMLFSLPLTLSMVWYVIILKINPNAEVGHIFSPDDMDESESIWKKGADMALAKLYYYLVHKGGLLTVGIISNAFNIFKLFLQLYQDYFAALEGLLFLNRLKRITREMSVLHKAYLENEQKTLLPYFKDIAAFMDDKTTPAYELVTQAPAEYIIRERVLALSYSIFGDLHYDMDKVLRDQKYKKALASFLVLHKMTNQLDSEKAYTLLEKTTRDETQITHPRIHIEHLRPFIAKKKADKQASENEEKDNKPSLAYDVNIGHKSRAYLLVGDDESVMKNYLACLGQNVLYTQNMGIIRGASQHYTACDKIFYADGYQDTREVHATRLADVLAYAKQHTDEKILVLVSNIAGKMSGAEHAAFVYSYAAELKKLSNVTFVFSTNNVQHIYQVIDMQKTHFTLLTPLLKDQKPTGGITIGRSQGHMQGIKMSPTVARNFREVLKRNPNYQGHLQDHVSKSYGNSILFLIIMIFMILGLMLFRKRKK
ncbi:MAG: hypothetical protein AAF900_01285 [Bacteroidota bacterium]